jgi:hypothetical protein
VERGGKQNGLRSIISVLKLVATFGMLYFPQPKNEVMNIIVSISNRRTIE